MQTTDVNRRQRLNDVKGFREDEGSSSRRSKGKRVKGTKEVIKDVLRKSFSQVYDNSFIAWTAMITFLFGTVSHMLAGGVIITSGSPCESIG